MRKQIIPFLYDFIKKVQSKHCLIYVYLAGFIIFFTGCDITTHSDKRIVFANAILYNQYIVVRHKELFEDIDIFNLASEHDNSFASKTLDTILKHATQSLADIQKMAPYNNDSSFRETSADFFKYYGGKFVEDGKKLILIKSKMDSGKVQEADYSNYTSLAKKIKSQSEPIESRLEEIQLRFARKNNFTLSGKTEDDD